MSNRRIVATYPYTTADGTVIYEKIRYEPKTFRIRRQNGGGWEWNAGEERVLYRLQNLAIASPDEPCWVNEGEKACDRLAALNLLSTCVATGWDGVDVALLRGRDCFVIRDDDQGGTDENADKKAFAAADALYEVARSVRIVRLPDLPSGGDVVDWLHDNCDDVAKLRALCEAAPTYEPPSAPPKSGKAANAVTLVWDCMAEVDPEPVDWIWSGRLARGKLTLVAGDPGLGKSQISLDVAARITTGSQFPDGDAAPAGSVLVLTAEDAAKDTVRPRLEAAGADLGRVHRLKTAMYQGGATTFSLQNDLAALGEKLNQVGDVTLVIIDPVTSYMGSKIDLHRVTDVRAVLEPLAAWAEDHHVAVLGITHPPKNAPPKALHAIVGSIAYVAAARLVFLAVEEPETERRLFLAVKNNLAPLAPGLGYSLTQTIIGKGIVASHVTWDSAPVTVSANEALAATNGGHNRAMSEAKDFLREELADGPRGAQDIKKAAQAAGLSWATIRRAQENLGIKPRKTGLDGGWQWQLPEDAHRRPEDAQP